jgi:hypothetical protein
VPDGLVWHSNAWRQVEPPPIDIRAQQQKPVFTAQKRQALPHVSPKIMIVAVRCSQHSPLFGQRASSHTVLSERWRRRRARSAAFAPVERRALIQSG